METVNDHLLRDGSAIYIVKNVLAANGFNAPLQSSLGSDTSSGFQGRKRGREMPIINNNSHPQQRRRRRGCIQHNTMKSGLHPRRKFTGAHSNKLQLTIMWLYKCSGCTRLR